MQLERLWHHYFPYMNHFKSILTMEMCASYFIGYTHAPCDPLAQCTSSPAIR